MDTMLRFAAYCLDFALVLPLALIVGGFWVTGDIGIDPIQTTPSHDDGHRPPAEPPRG